MSYAVSTPVFEGPFDLLLHLIAKEQVNLFEVSISRIVDAFLGEIEQMQALDLDLATEFLLIAATLVELKLRKLLPERSTVEMDEELALLEERDLLLAKLLEYQTFRHAAAALARLETVASRSFGRVGVAEDRFSTLTPDPLANTTPEQLRAAFVRAITRTFLPKPESRVNLGHMTDVTLTVAEAVGELVEALTGRGRTIFRSLFGVESEPMHVIVRFLAVLELYKQGWIEIDQASSFGELAMIWQPDGPESLRATAPRLMPIPTVEGHDLSLDDLEDEAVESELDAALVSAAAERLAAGRAMGHHEVLVGGIRIDVDDYEG